MSDGVAGRGSRIPTAWGFVYLGTARVGDSDLFARPPEPVSTRCSAWHTLFTRRTPLHRRAPGARTIMATSGKAFGISLAIYSAICIIVFLLFSWWRSRDLTKKFYAPKRYVRASGHKRPPRLRNRLGAWAGQVGAGAPGGGGGGSVGGVAVKGRGSVGGREYRGVAVPMLRGDGTLCGASVRLPLPEGV